MNRLTQKVLIIASLATFIGCARTQIKDKNAALRVSDSLVSASDDLGWESFAQDLSKYVVDLQKTGFTKQTFAYEKQTWTGEEILEAYRKFSTFLLSKPTPETSQAYLQQNFIWMEVYGLKKWSDVFITSYFEPLYHGSLTKTKKHSHPVYLQPKDLVQVDLTDFAKAHPQLEPYLGYIQRGEPGPRNLNGRYDEKTKKIYPYYNREEIVDKGKLAKRNLEIAWLDPVDNFFLQIQGSGTIVINDQQKIQVGFAGQNGHAYAPIGKFLTDKIPLEEITMTKIDNYLRTLPYEEQAKILNQNPSYVFFQKLKTRPLTSHGTEVFDGRTIATDSFFLPKGLIGLLEFQKPVSDTEPKFETTKRFIFNQDSGGAIKGPGRVDLFWGKGVEAGHYAGAVKANGQLWFLLPKK